MWISRVFCHCFNFFHNFDLTENFLFQHVENELPNTTYDPEFMADLMDNANLVRNVALVGHLHHGKSSFVDCLIHQTHPDLQTKEDKPLR